MAARWIALTDAVVVSLNAGTFSQAFTAARFYQPIFKTEDMNTLHVSVVPRTSDQRPLARVYQERDIKIDIGIQKRLEPFLEASLDPLSLLAEEIAEHFAANGWRTLTLPSGEQAKCVGVTVDPIYFPAHLEEFRQFTSVVTPAFKVLTS